MATTISHPSLGAVHGKQGDGVVQFLGIKYGGLKDRLSPSEVFGDYPKDGIDATKIGPLVASPPQGVDMEFGLIQKSIPKPDFSISDLEGLNLNITVPATQDGNALVGKKLPVFVYVHGGGFAIGSGSWPQWDQSRIVKQSVDHGTPVIGVGINYRLGIPGFLTSDELLKAGYKANNGIYDQITAFRWINKNIGGFGGDPDNVTFLGQSAGGASGTLLLHSEEPLFKRLISMGGTSVFIKPFPSEMTEAAYKSVLESLDVDKLSPDERVKALLETPVNQLLTKVPPTVQLSPSVDNMISFGLTFEGLKSGEQVKLLPGLKWCESLLIGDCQLDGMIFILGLNHRKPGIAKVFTDSVTRNLSSKPGAAKALLSAYSITPSTPDSEAFLSILKFGNDISFYAPTLAMSSAWPGQKFVFRFNQGNPWEGEFKGHATHILDAAFVFQNFAEHMDEEAQGVARDFADVVLKFVNGKVPWSPEGEKVIGGEQTGDGKGQEAETSGRRQAIVKLGEEFGLDELLSTWLRFLSGN